MDPAELKRLGLSPADLVDFSVNSNPFGPSPRVLAAMQRVDISSYPDRHCTALRDVLAQINQVSSQEILVGNGTAELIWLAVISLLRPGDEVLIAGPTFGEYQRAAAAVGARITVIRAQPPDFALPLEPIGLYVRQHKPRLVFVCNPNNPTGTYLAPHVLDKLVETCGLETIFIFDESYRAFVEGRPSSSLPPGNALVLRSMTKDFTLAGLRLGYVLGNPAWLDQLRRFQPAWSVNAFAQAAGTAALLDGDYYQRTLAALTGLKNDFFANLHALGYTTVRTDVHFGLIDVGGPAYLFRQRLIRLGCQVRDCASFGLPQYIRVSTRTEPDNRKLLAALQALRESTISAPATRRSPTCSASRSAR